MSVDPTADIAAPRDVIMTSLYHADHAFLTRDLADYLALFLVVVLGLFRLDAVIKRLNIGIRMTCDVGCETEEIPAEVAVSPTIEPSLGGEIHERNCRDFACNTSYIQLCDKESNTERINLPIVLTASPVNRYTECGTNTEAVSGLLFTRKTLISECTQTSRANLKLNISRVSAKSRIPVLLKKGRFNHSQKAQTPTVELDSSSSVTSSLSIPELFGGTASFYPSSRLSTSPSGWEDRTTPPSPTRTITPEVQELSRLLPKSSPKSEVLKKSSTWSDRYRYCDSSIRNDVLLRSSPKKKDSATATIERTARWSVGENQNNSPGSPKLGRSKCVRKCRSFGGEVTEYTENSFPQNFVLNPRLRHSSNRRVFKVTYVAGS